MSEIQISDNKMSKKMSKQSKVVLPFHDMRSISLNIYGVASHFFLPCVDNLTAIVAIHAFVANYKISTGANIIHVPRLYLRRYAFLLLLLLFF